MNMIRTYKLKMDLLTTRVTASLAHVASLQTSEEYDVKVHKDIKVDAGMNHLTKLFLQDKKSGKRLFDRHQFMVTVGPLAVATVSDRKGVFELLIPNSLRYNDLYKRNDHMGEANLLLTGHQSQNQKWGIGQTREQQRSAAARRKETVTIAGHTRKKIRRKSSARWTT
jgi:hypothetical protein